MSDIAGSPGTKAKSYTYRVASHWDERREVWFVRQSEVPNLVAEGRTQEQLIRNASLEATEILKSPEHQLKFRFHVGVG